MGTGEEGSEPKVSQSTRAGQLQWLQNQDQGQGYCTQTQYACGFFQEINKQHVGGLKGKPTGQAPVFGGPSDSQQTTQPYLQILFRTCFGCGEFFEAILPKINHKPPSLSLFPPAPPYSLVSRPRCHETGFPWFWLASETGGTQKEHAQQTLPKSTPSQKRLGQREFHQSPVANVYLCARAGVR